MAIQIGKREVLASGSVLVERRLPVSLPVHDLTITINLLKTDDGKPAAGFKTTGEKSLELSLTNFDNTLGAAFDHPIGEINGRQLVMAV
jgi:hypothetical protein